MKKASRTAPPPDWKPPSGLCECGCGKKTKIVKTTSVSIGHYAGYPLRFIHAHHTGLISGPAHAHWKGGRIVDAMGYIRIRVDRAYRLEHVMVWEKHRGPITKGHVIHHINHDRADNRISNLICLTRGQHSALHEAERRAHRTAKH